MLKRIIGQLFTWFGVFVLFGLSVIRTMLDVVGYSTAQGDAAELPQAAQAAFIWLLQIPWWVPWGSFLAAFMWLTWWSWTPHRVTGATADASLLKQQRLARKEDRATAAVEPSKPLTAHAVERKLKVIDAALDLLKRVQPIIESGPRLLRDEWHTSGTSGVVPYPSLVRSLVDEIRTLAQRIDEFRDANPEYQDIVGSLGQTYYNFTVPALATFANGCEDATRAISEGAKFNTIYHPMVGNHVGTFEQGLKRLEDWRNKARGDLATIRSAISAH